MLSTNVTLASAESAPALSPFVVGGIALTILFLSLIVLLAFAGGREHS